MQTSDTRQVTRDKQQKNNLAIYFCFWSLVSCLWSLVCFSGCTVKAVGDPNRPITINAHVTVDIRGLKETATNIEDYVSGETGELPTKSGEKK